MNRFFAFLVLLFTNSPTLKASHHLDVLKEGMTVAEKALNLKNTSKYVYMLCEAGTIYRGGERWGIIEPISGKECGGYCTKLKSRFYCINIGCPPLTMKPALYRVVHECGHVLLFEKRIPQEDHERILAEAKI